MCGQRRGEAARPAPCRQPACPPAGRQPSSRRGSSRSRSARRPRLLQPQLLGQRRLVGERCPVQPQVAHRVPRQLLHLPRLQVGQRRRRVACRGGGAQWRERGRRDKEVRGRLGGGRLGESAAVELASMQMRGAPAWSKPAAAAAALAPSASASSSAFRLGLAWPSYCGAEGGQQKAGDGSRSSGTRERCLAAAAAPPQPLALTSGGQLGQNRRRTETGSVR